MERQPNTQYILSLSYGKDSLACLAAIEQLGLPLDRIVHAEVWATDTIPADLPPMMDFKKKADAIIKERWGIEVEHICAMAKDGTKQTYEKLFYHVPKRRQRNAKDDGKPNGFPLHSGGFCNDQLKVNPLKQIGGAEPRFTQGTINGFANIRTPYCTGQLKIRPQNLGVPNHQRELVYQLPQAQGFLIAPSHRERKQILCNILVSLLMNRSELPDIQKMVLCYRW